MKISLTKRQKELLEIIYKYIKNTGYPPSFEEMRQELNVVSNQSILDLLNKLIEKKAIKKDEGTARGLKILPLGFQLLGKAPAIPLLGTTSAGSPLEAVEITGEWQTVSPEVAQLKDNIFLLKISGDSMINAGIDDGDLVLVKEEKEFITGDIVLIRNNGETTVKRFISGDKPPYVYLKPENSKYKIIPFDDGMEIIGKVISVFKDGWWRGVK